LTSLAILFYFLCAQHVSDINMSIIRSCASACNTDTTPIQPQRNSNTHRTKNNTTNVVIQQTSRKLLMMDILMSETCWAHKEWNKIASDIKLVFYSLTLTMMHGPINVRFFVWLKENSKCSVQYYFRKFVFKYFSCTFLRPYYFILLPCIL